MLQNYLIALNIVNILHTLQKVKRYLYHGNFAFSSIQITVLMSCLHYNILVKFM